MAAQGGGGVKAQPKCFAADPTYGTRRTARIQCEAAPDYSLAVHDGMAVLRLHDPCDDYQRWVKDETFGDKVKDHYGFPSFALVNKATGLAIRHPTAANRLVQLVPYSREYFDETVLWTEGDDGEYQAIRMLNNTALNLDAFGGNTAVRDGTQIGVWQWNAGTNQLWKLTHYDQTLSPPSAADVFLWGNKKVSAGVLTVATAIWVLFELLDYHLLTLVCHSLILSLVISAATTFVNKSPTRIPEVQIPEDLAVNIALALRCEINRAFSVLRDIAVGRDPGKFLLVIAGLWVLSILGSTFNFLTLFCIAFAFVHTVALLYEKYEDKVDAFGEKAMIEFNKHYAVSDDKVPGKIPKGPLEDKKH